MGKPTGFMEYKREVSGERLPLERTSDWNEYQLSMPKEKLQKQGARCMDCGTPFCHMGIEINGNAAGCPLYNLIPEWNDLVYRGRWKEALERLQKTNNFPEFTGRVCPAPCEGSCTVAISDPAVAIKSIEKEIIDKGFENGWIRPNPPKNRTGRAIAVIGSGPAGLAAADQLNKAGHYVTVYERSDRIGGLLTYGIPNMKLDKGIVERRVNLLREEGITFVTNTEVGKDISSKELHEKYDSVILCTGAQKHRDTEIEGRSLKGIHFAMDYLTTTTKSLLDSQFEDGKAIDVKGKNVIVIGGGDTGADCVATAIRQNCNSVVQFGKHPQLEQERQEGNPWPEYPHVFTLDYAYAEAKAQFGTDPRQYEVLTKRFIGDENGQIKALETVRVKKEKDSQGKLVVSEIEGSEKIWPVDCVFIAIGFTGVELPIVKNFELDTTNRNTIKADYGKYTTNKEGVFAAGDARRGQSLIVWAINEGRGVAKEVDRYLMGETQLP
jgi:glutamate synthase (NADPH) small chain